MHCNGASFWNHELRAKYNSRVANLSREPILKNSQLYNSLTRIARHLGSMKARKILQQLDINLVASKDCCSKHWAQTFLKEKIKLLRERMYVGTTFQFRSHLKLDVHR